MDRTPHTAPQDPAPGPTTAEWPRKAVDVIDRVVGTFHDRAIRPIALVARAIVFGLLVAALGTVVLVLLSITILRILNVYAFEHRQWLSYLVLGGFFTLVGLFAWTRRYARTDGEAERA